MDQSLDSREPTARWWVRPLLVAIANYAVILPVIHVFIGWSTPVFVVLAVGLIAGSTWFFRQRPRCSRAL